MTSTKLLLRLLIVGGLVLSLLIPLAMIRGVIDERAHYRQQASERIARSTAGAQRLTGPLRVVPWTDTREIERTDDKGIVRRRTERTQGQVLQTPGNLDIAGEMIPETRRIGLFEVRVYTLRATLQATFDPTLPDTPAGVNREYGKPYLIMGLSDVRGLVGTPGLSVDGRPQAFEPGTRDYAGRLHGVSADLAPLAGNMVAGNDVRIDLTLAGTESLAIVPAADSNRFTIRSSWPHPSFSGDFLPTRRTVEGDGGGFSASWEISSLASQASTLIGRDDLAGAVPDSLTIGLIDPVDVYTQADRASKYGILFIVLTFVGFGLLELIRRLPIHPLQYLLVGLALAIFFLLLLSLSEHIAFWKAYVASTIACIGLQFAYLSGVLRSRARAGGFAAMLSALYGALYSLLVSEDNALLMGSLLLFGVLAGIMWVTRKVDWYALGGSLR